MNEVEAIYQTKVPYMATEAITPDKGKRIIVETLEEDGVISAEEADKEISDNEDNP